MGERQALLVGINDYGSKSGFQPLKYAVNDAKELGYTLETTCGYGIKLLTGSDATRPNIFEALDKISGSDGLDLFLFYFAGHGEEIRKVGTYCLHCFGSRASIPVETLDLPTLTAYIQENIPARHYVFILDACRNEMYADRGIRGNLGMDPSVYNFLKTISEGGRYAGGNPFGRPEGLRVMVTLLACGSGQVSYEDKDLEHGVFTYAFIQEIRRGLGKTPLNEIGMRVGDWTAEWCLGKELIPVQRPEWVGPMSIDAARLFLVESDSERLMLGETHGHVKHIEGLVHKCPLCGRRNEEQETFHCRRCNTDYLCLIHQVEGSWMCEECEKERKKRALRIEVPNVIVCVPSERENKGPYKDSHTGMEFVFVKGGTFQMDYNSPLIHEVYLSDFYIGKYQVTQRQWTRIMGDNPTYCAGLFPVENVSWNDVQEFIMKLYQETLKRFRLPSESEWEYAARSRGKRHKWSGTNDISELDGYAWYGGQLNNSNLKTHPVGMKKPNELGIYDMTGNIWEWCEDWYDLHYYKNSPRDNPKGPSWGDMKVMRGGCCQTHPEMMCTYTRSRAQPNVRFMNVGFRLVLLQE